MRDPVYARMLWRLPERYGIEPKALDYLLIVAAIVYILGMFIFKGFFVPMVPTLMAVSIGFGVLSKKNEEDSRFFSSYAWSLKHKGKKLVPRKMTLREARKIRVK